MANDNNNADCSKFDYSDPEFYDTIRKLVWSLKDTGVQRYSSDLFNECVQVCLSQFISLELQHELDNDPVRNDYTFFCSVARNELRNFNRKVKRIRSREVADSDFISWQASDPMHNESREVLEVAISKMLEGLDKTFAELHYLQDLTHSEIAKHMQISNSRVTDISQRVVVILRMKIRDDEFPECAAVAV